MAGRSDVRTQWFWAHAFARRGSPLLLVERLPTNLRATLQVSTAYFVNRMDGNLNRIVTGNGAVSLYNLANVVTATLPITSSKTVSTLTFNTPTVQPTPDPASAIQSSAALKSTTPRYVRLTAATGQCLAFREIMVFDSTYT